MSKLTAILVEIRRMATTLSTLRFYTVVLVVILMVAIPLIKAVAELVVACR